MKMTYTCPVCGYSMPDPPRDNNICPSCGVEFGYSDAGRSFDDLRREWIRIGMPWHSRFYRPPQGWSPQLQLLQSGLLPVRISGIAEEEVAPDVFVWDPQIAASERQWTSRVTSAA